MRRYIKFKVKNQKLKVKTIQWISAPDIKRRINILTSSLELNWLKTSRLFCFRSTNAKTRAYARIWGLGRIWQQALNIPSAYVIEVISEKYDKLSESEQDKVLLHELTHIPRNFSGSLVPHIRRGKRSFHRKVDELIRQYLLNKS